MAAAQNTAGMALPSAQLRQFPAQALRGQLEMTNWPEVLLNNKPQRLASGARIRNASNAVVLPVGLRGQRLLVNYVLNSQGQIQDAWILTPQEAALKGNESAPAVNIQLPSRLLQVQQ